jgi:hypothetical protein
LISHIAVIVVFLSFIGTDLRNGQPVTEWSINDRLKGSIPEVYPFLQIKEAIRKPVILPGIDCQIQPLALRTLPHLRRSQVRPIPAQKRMSYTAS